MPQIARARNLALRRPFGRWLARPYQHFIADHCVVSYFFHRTKRLGEQHELSDFVRHPWWGIDRLITYLNDWHDHRRVPALYMTVRYEDMQKNAGAELLRVWRFIGLPDPGLATIQEAVNYASFANMRRLASGVLRDVKAMAPASPDDTQSFKMRAGKMGGYVDHLSEDDMAYLTGRIDRDLNPAFGYSRG